MTKNRQRPMVLDMATIRHGDGSHFMRPDRVYRTGVIAPMMGYQPQADVEAVTMVFSQGPARGMMLAGLGQPGPLQRLGLRIRAALADRRARRFMTVNGLGMPGAEPALAQQISPHLARQMSGVLALMQGRYGTGYPAAAADAMVNRPLLNWYPY